MVSFATKKKRMSKPNERSCRIFLEKMLGFSPPRSLFFWWQKFFFQIFRKNVEIFLLLDSLKKISKNFLQSISLKKKFDIFSENSRKRKLCHKKKGGHRGEGVKIPTSFPGKSDTTFRWVLMYCCSKSSHKFRRLCF